MSRVYPVGWGPSQRAALNQLCSLLERGAGARVGETAVVSTKVHLTDQTSPEEVQVVATSDAGRAFYGRCRSGEVVHVDVFHSPGDVPPSAVAQKVMMALSVLRLEDCGSATSPASLVSFIDVQTSLGGGRLDGSLTGGRETGVRMAHKTHVHLAFLNRPELLASVFAVIGAVEQAITVAGLELRKVRRVRMVRGDAPADLSDYRAVTDSFLREGKAAGGSGKVEFVPRTLPGGGAPGDPSGSQGVRPVVEGCTAAGESENAGAEPQAYPQVSGDVAEALAREAVRAVGSYEDAVRLLRSLSEGMRGAELLRFRPGTAKDPEEIREALLRSRLMTSDGLKYRLSAEGETVLRYLLSHRYEFEAYLRRLLRTLSSKKRVPAQKARAPLRQASSCKRAIAAPLEKGCWCGDLAVAETVLVRAVRGSRTFRRDDLRFYFRREERSQPVILLIDASASMAGKRLQSAKELARMLVLTGKDDVAVCTFQDADVRVVSGFTRNPRQVEQALSSIEASGLTPLARGLEGAMALARTKAVKPLVLLITDGIPTVPSVTLSPVEDAIEAARNLARNGIKLGCVGLEPNRTFLKQLAEAARGTLYIVDEIESSLLASIARKERGY